MLFQNVDPELLREAYTHAPQLRDYHALGLHVHPYVTFVSERNRRSKVVTTDADGFRRTPSPRGLIDTSTATSELDGAVLGGSFTFGVGATSDAATLVAAIARSRGECWVNLGIRGGNSTQELASVMPFVIDIPRIVVCSGANNLVAALQTSGENDVYGPLFFERSFLLMNSVLDQDLKDSADSTLHSARRAIDLIRRKRGATLPETGARPSTQRSGTTPAQRLQLALARQVRDLTLLVRMCGDPRKVVFCTQPFAEAHDRDYVPEERRLIGLYDHRQHEPWRRVLSFALASWSSYVQGLREACVQLGVAFRDLPARDLRGWSFIDRLHLTDEGYRQAALAIMEALE
jgi:hypothetical protein